MAIALLLTACNCGGDAAPERPEPPEAEAQTDEADAPLFASDEPVELALDDGESLLVATGGRLVRVPKAGGEATTLATLEDRVIRDVARIGRRGVAILSYPRGDGPRSVSPPGDLRLLTLDTGAAPRVFMADASISVQVETRNGALLLLDAPDDWTARVRTFDPDRLEVRESWSMSGRGLPSVLLADDRGVFVGLETLSGTSAIGLHRLGADQSDPPLFGGPIDTEFALAGDDLLALVSAAEPTTGPGGAARVENPGALMRIDRQSHESSTVGDRGFRNGRDLVVGPRHACVVEHFPERLPASAFDVTAIPLNGQDPPITIAEERGEAHCLLVDEDAVFLATPRGVERVALAQ